MSAPLKVINILLKCLDLSGLNVDKLELTTIRYSRSKETMYMFYRYENEDEVTNIAMIKRTGNKYKYCYCIHGNRMTDWENYNG